VAGIGAAATFTMPFFAKHSYNISCVSLCLSVYLLQPGRKVTQAYYAVYYAYAGKDRKE